MVSNDVQKRKYITNIIDDLQYLNGPEFEQLSYCIGEYILGIDMHKRGLTILGNPSGYTLDAYSDDFRKCIESSSEQNYFNEFSNSCDGRNTKIQHDIEHALSMSSPLRIILLFSNQICSNSQAQNVATYISYKETENSINIEWYDARRIGEYIVEKLLDQSILLEKIANYIPTVNRIMSLEANYNSMPMLPENYVFNNEIDTIIKKLDNNKVIFISGISGIGKSLLSVEIAQKIYDKFDTLYYIDGNKIENETSLESIDLFGTNGRINLLGNIKRAGALIIIDDLRAKCEEIARIIKKECNSDTRVIISSQQSIKDEDITYHLSFPSFEQGVKILEYNNDSCPKKLLQLIKEKTNFHPLILAILSEMVNEQGCWDFVNDELAFCPKFETDSGEMVCSRLLRHYMPLLNNEFQAIKWLNTQYINSFLLKKMIGLEGFRKLKKRSLISDLSGYSIKVHDIIFACIKEVITEKCDYRKDFLDFFKCEFLKKNAKYYQAIHMHQEKILEILETNPKPGLALFIYLDIWSNDAYDMIKKISVDEYIKNCSKTIQNDLCAEYSIVQLIECDYKTYKGDKEDKNEYAKKQVNLLQKLLDLQPGAEEFHIYVMHHLGKLYSFIRENEKAADIFRRVIERKPDYYEAKLQLARLLLKEQGTREEGIGLVCNIIDEYNPEELSSMTVILAAYEEIRKTNNNKLIAKYFVSEYKKFNYAIHAMALENFDQPYRVLANVSKVFTYEYPQLLKDVVESIPIPSSSSIDKRYAFPVAELYKELGKSILWEDTNGESYDEASLYFEQAELLYTIANKVDPYSTIMHAENLNRLKRYKEAMGLLELLELSDDDKSMPYWEYRLAESMYGIGDDYLKPALLHISHGCDLCGEKYLSAFEALKADILFALRPSDSDWEICIKQAIEHADREKYKISLCQKFDKMKESVGNL